MDVPPQVMAALTSEQGHAAVSSGDTCAILRLVRRRTGMQQAEVAERSGYSQPTISRAERGQINDPVVLTDIADVLGVPHDALGLSGAHNPAAPTLDDMERREMLKGVLAVASAALLPRQIIEAAAGGNRKIGAADVQQCVDALRRLYELDYVQGGRPVYELTASMASRLRDTVGRATYGPAVGRKLRGVTAATFENAGWLAFWGPADLSWHEMTAARAAGKPTVAETAAHTAISHADPETMPRNHAIYTASLGHTLARAGRFDEAIEVSRTVLANPAAKGSSRPAAELQATARVLSVSAYPQAQSFGATVAKLTGTR